MLNEIRNWPVHWVDGMKISKDHFLAIEQFFVDHLKDARALYLNDLNYGLLPPLPDSRSSLDVQILSSGNSFQCIVNECRAITPGGLRIELTNFTIKYFNLSSKLQFTINDVTGNSFYVLLGTNPFSRVPGGPPDPNESPTRHPYVSPNYHIEAVPVDEVNTGSLGDKFLVIAKIVKRGSEYAIDNRYIPPCAVVSSHPVLIEYAKRWSTLLNEIQEDSFKIIQKVYAKKPSSAIAENTKQFAETFARYISQISFSFNTQASFYTPVQLINTIASLAGITDFVLKYINVTEKEELLNYYSEWTEWNSNQLEAIVSEVLKMKYDHNEIATSVGKADNFITSIATLMNRLASLEYIGKKKEKDIFIREVDKKQQEIKEAKKVWKPLDF